MLIRYPLPDDVWLDHRADWQEVHDRFAADMDDALAEIAERQEPEPVCEMCRGRGWFMATDERAPWREHKTECECCT